MKPSPKKIATGGRATTTSRSKVSPPIVEPPAHGRRRGQVRSEGRSTQGADPEHRFHEMKQGDTRVAVAAGEAVQRLRGRH